MPRRRPALVAVVLAAAGLLVACGSASGPARPSGSAAVDGATHTVRVLFDDTKAETAGNADWIISTSMPDPTRQDATPSKETDWSGGISAWGVALQRTGSYSLMTLRPRSTITYGGGGSLDLSRFDVFVLPEPNVLLTASEKTAVMTFVKNGGGLFLICDHVGSDRNGDGVDSVGVLDDLMTNNSVDAHDPFGFSIDALYIRTENPDVIGSSAPRQVVDGPFGKVHGTIIRGGTTATLHPSDNAAVRGDVYRSQYSASGTRGVAFATSTFGRGRVAWWGDSSTIDDGTGRSGDELYDGWNDSHGSDSRLALNATAWLGG